MFTSFHIFFIVILYNYNLEIATNLTKQKGDMESPF